MSDIATHITSLVTDADLSSVRVPVGFAPLGSRDVIEETLQCLVASETLRRINRDPYDLPVVS